MEIKVTEDEDLHKKFLITYTTEDVQECLVKEAEEMKKDVKLDGFRPGKVPVEYILRMYGEKIRVEAMNKRVTDDVVGIIEKNDFRLAVSPLYNFKDRNEVDDANFYVEVGLYLFPNVPDLDFTKVEIEKIYPDEKSFEEIVDKNLLMFQVVSSEFEEKDGEIAEHDRVKCDVEVSHEGEKLDGLSDESLFLVGHEQMPDEIEIKILGMKKGEEREFEHFYEKDGKSPFFEELRGKSIKFNIKILEVSSPILTELTQEKLEKIGFESADKLVEAIRNNSRAMLERISDSKSYRDLMEYMKNNFDFSIHDAIIDQEAHQIAYDNASKAGNFDAMKELLDGNKKIEVTDDHKSRAADNLRRSFVLSEYARKNDIKVEEWEIKREMETHIGELQKINEANPGQKEKNFKEFSMRVQTVAFEAKTVSAIMDAVQRKEVLVSKEDFFKRTA